MTTVAIVKKNGYAAIAADTLTKWGSGKESAAYIANNTKIVKVGDGYLAASGTSTFKLILSDHYHLTFASNGIEAMERIRQSRPELVMLDIKMPKINGLELLKEIKKLDRSLPVIIVTGYQSVETAQEALRNGATDYIPKPFESKQILKAVARVL